MLIQRVLMIDSHTYLREKNFDWLRLESAVPSDWDWKEAIGM